MDFVESKLVELKETIVDDIKKEVIAFINSEGGNLYVGVADDGHVIGLDDPQSDMLRLTNMIRDTIKPDATMFVECQIEKIDTKDIVRVQVQKGTHAPYYLVGKGIRPEGVFVRQGTSSVPASSSSCSSRSCSSRPRAPGSYQPLRYLLGRARLHRRAPPESLVR